MAIHKRVMQCLVALWAPLAMSGCSGIEVMHESAYCPGGIDKQAVMVRDQAALDAIWRLAQNSTQAPPAPRPDFKQRRIVYLADMEHPTAGYGLDLASDILTVNQSVAMLKLNTTRPGGMVAQVITRPCLLLSLPGGDYERVQVYDASGPLWAEIGGDQP